MKKRFDPRNVLTICEGIGRCNWALRAFGALLESADLERLFCNSEKAEAYRAGLNLLITIFIDHQEDQLHTLSKLAESRLEQDRGKKFKAVELTNRSEGGRVVKN